MTPEEQCAWELISKLQQDVFKAQDNILKAKVTQAAYANLTRHTNIELDIRDHIMLSTKNRRQQYAVKGDKRVAKFMPRFDGPYSIADMNHKASMVTLNVPHSSNVYPTFHTAEVMPFNENDQSLFPSHELAWPRPIFTKEGMQEHYVEKIIDAQKCGCGMQYLIRWLGYGPGEDEWLPGSELANNAALDDWLAGSQ